MTEHIDICEWCHTQLDPSDEHLCWCGAGPACYQDGCKGCEQLAEADQRDDYNKMGDA